MTFDPLLADIRFGCGRSPAIAPPADMAAMMALLTGPDRAAEAFPVPGYEAVRERQAPFAAERGEIARAKTEAERKAMQADYLERYRESNKQMGREYRFWTWNLMMRRAHTGDGFRERLVGFWIDHFADAGKSGPYRLTPVPSDEDVIRPHVAGRFADMVKAVITQPLMLQYLDQQTSRGPNSKAVQKRGRGGLNENLARELMELHTLGVDGPYTQADVRELAELLTGLSIGPDLDFRFHTAFAEPGAETVLGKSYGGGPPRIEDVLAAVEDLATHPATARHIAGKLAVHFVADAPDPALVDHLAARFAATGGDLAEVSAALLEHPASWDPAPGNVKRPVDFIGSALRLLAVSPESEGARRGVDVNDVVLAPLALMGQAREHPPGPDGWPEADGTWVSPQRLAARVRWAWTAPPVLVPDLPDPRDLLEVAVGDRADDALRLAVARAASRIEGVALVLCAPAFQRM